MRADELELTDYLTLGRRRWKTLVAVTILGILAAGAISALQTPKYRATTQVLIANASVQRQLDLGGVASARDRERELRNEVEFAKSNRVESAVEESVGYEVKAQIAPDADADNLRISVVDTDPEVAAEAANAYADAYIDQRVRFATQSYLDASAVLQDRLDQILADRTALEDQLEADPDLETSLAGSIASLTAEESRLRGQLSELELVNQLTDIGVAQINRSAEVPESPFSPNWIRNLLLGLVAGGLGGVGLALLSEALHDAVRTRTDLRSASNGLPVIGTIPEQAGGRRRGGAEQPMLVTQRTGGFREGFRSLRSSLSLLQSSDDLRVILVTSANPSEGKSTTSANIALSMAQIGQRVLLIDADLRSPSIHQFLQVKNQAGLSDFISTGSDFTTVREQATGEQLIEFLAAGPPSDAVADELANGRFETLIDKLRGSFDLIVVDTPPILPLSDTLQLARSVDGVIFVARSNSTTTGDVEEALDRIERVGASVIGTVLTFADSTVDKYGYGYGYGSTKKSRRNG